jgi:hypothetical protein
MLDELMQANAEANLGVVWKEGWILMASLTTKIWIDMFIGVWAFVLALQLLTLSPGYSTVT